MAIVDKQWQKVVNIQRVDPFKYKEIKHAGRLPDIQTYHPSVIRVDKTMINDFKSIAD